MTGWLLVTPQERRRREGEAVSMNMFGHPHSVGFNPRESLSLTQRAPLNSVFFELFRRVLHRFLARKPDCLSNRCVTDFSAGA